jgi:hypothetical protein
MGVGQRQVLFGATILVLLCAFAATATAGPLYWYDGDKQRFGRSAADGSNPQVLLATTVMAGRYCSRSASKSALT